MSIAGNLALDALQWDLSWSDSVEKSQRWILTAMQKHGQSLITMLWRILGNEEDVCDVYQQTFLNLAHCNNKKPRNIKAYIFRSASNIAISTLRRARTRRDSIQVIRDMSPTTHEVDYANELDSQELQERLRDAIAELPEYLRNVVLLRDMAEMPYKHVGKVLGISEATARVYRSKAVTLLAALLNGGKGR